MASQFAEPTAGTAARVPYRPRSPPRTRVPFVERIGSSHAKSLLTHSQVPNSSIETTPTTTVFPRSPSPVFQHLEHGQRGASRQGNVQAPQGSVSLIKDDPHSALDVASAGSAPHPKGKGYGQGRSGAPSQSPPTPTLFQGEDMQHQGSHYTAYPLPSPVSAYQNTSATQDGRHHSSSHRHRLSHHHHRHHHPSTTHHVVHHHSRSGPPNAASHRYASRLTRSVNGHGSSATSNTSHTSPDGNFSSQTHHHATPPPPGTAGSYYQGTGLSRTSSASSQRSHVRVPSPSIPASITIPHPAHRLEKPPPSPPPSANEIHRLTHRPHLLTASEFCRNPHRPALPPNYDGQMETRYVNMLLAMDGISPFYYVLSSFFTWILLAGFVLFPGTFASFQNQPAGSAASAILNLVNHLGLYVIAFLCTGIGACGMIWLWWRWHGNYVWVSNRIFIPGFLNSVAGVISSLASIYGIEGGQFGRTEKSAIFVTASLSVICGILVLVYELWLIRNLKLEHDHEVGVELAGKYGEGVLGEKRDGNGGA